MENSSLGLVVQGGKLAVQGFTKVAACRNALVEKGLGALLGIGAAKTALDNLSSTLAAWHEISKGKGLE